VLDDEKDDDDSARPGQLPTPELHASQYTGGALYCGPQGAKIG
jgi:hypothetical protein